MKDYRQRPKYRRLLDYAFIKQYEKEDVDVAAWFAGEAAASVSLLAATLKTLMTLFLDLCLSDNE